LEGLRFVLTLNFVLGILCFVLSALNFEIEDHYAAQSPKAQSSKHEDQSTEHKSPSSKLQDFRAILQFHHFPLLVDFDVLAKEL
jgi:hypothetical protein